MESAILFMLVPLKVERTDRVCEPEAHNVSTRLDKAKASEGIIWGRTDTYKVAGCIPALSGARLGRRHGGLGKAQRRSLLDALVLGERLPVAG